MSLVRTKTLFGVLVAAHTLVPGLLAIGLVDVGPGYRVYTATERVSNGERVIDRLRFRVPYYRLTRMSSRTCHATPPIDTRE